MTKLLMLITSLAGGGAERVASELSLNLSPNIERQIVVLTDKISYPSNNPPISMNLKFKRPLILSFIYAMITGTIKYRNLVRKYKPEVSLSFLTLDNIINVLANIESKNTMTIVSVHASLTNKFGSSLSGKLIKLILQKIYSRASLIIAVSEGVEQELIHQYNIPPTKIKVLYNPINLQNIEIMAGEQVLDEKFPLSIPTIINVGRLSKAKGQWNLIRAFSKVREKTECKLCIIGTGQLETYLKNLTKELNLDDDVIFLGWKDNPFKYLSKSSFFVLSSISEALPYALIEAMACGCPIIATDCKYGPREILNNGEFGILIPPMDGKFNNSCSLTKEEQLLAEKMIDLLQNKDMRLKFAEKSAIRSIDFDISKTIKAYNEILLSE